MTRGNKIKINAMREGGSILASVLQTLASMVTPGVAVEDIVARGEQLIREAGAEPSFKGYQPAGADRPYPAAVCVSLNDEVVHGLANGRVAQYGDILSFDAGVHYKGYHTDSAITVAVGAVPDETKNLMRVTQAALQQGIDQVQPGNTTGDIGHAIQTHVEKNSFRIVQGLAGHGIGTEIHEELMVCNEGTPGKGTLLEPGMTFAVEPMVTTGRGEIALDNDGFTYRVTDGALVAHFEHTVAVTQNGVEVLTRP